MRCDLDKVPSVGLFGMVVHQGGLRAQKMFDKYGLNKSQAGILFMLHHEEAVSQKPLSQKELAKKAECDGAVYYICDSEDGEGWIYQTTAGRKGSKDHASVSG